ncbi:MAG: hypothetical protein ACK5LM_05470 [Lactovum sp.]
MYIRIIENLVEESQTESYTKNMEAFVQDLLTLESCLSIDIFSEKGKVTTIERWQSENDLKKSVDILTQHKPSLKKAFLSNTEKIYRS